jgi:Tfp pilus assembly protein FimV
MGEQVWRDSGLGAPVDVEELQRRVASLEQMNTELTAQLEERDAELEAARGQPGADPGGEPAWSRPVAQCVLPRYESEGQ